jgi:nucleotide-binding universal stress UspA family protein
MKVLVAYDGTTQSKDALRYGLEKVKSEGGELIAMHVFPANLFNGYDAIPEARDEARRESAAYIEEAKKILQENGKGLKVCIVEGYGVPGDEILRYAEEQNVDVLLCPPRFKSIINKFKKLLDERGKYARETVIADKSSSAVQRKTAVEIRAA